jgi:hypothetical protein
MINLLLGTLLGVVSLFLYNKFKNKDKDYIEVFISGSNNDIVLRYDSNANTKGNIRILGSNLDEEYYISKEVKLITVGSNNDIYVYGIDLISRNIIGSNNDVSIKELPNKKEVPIEKMNDEELDDYIMNNSKKIREL